MFTDIAYIKKRWSYELYCKVCNRVIARQHKRKTRMSIVRGPDFYKPYLCKCGACLFLIDNQVPLMEVVKRIGVFKGVVQRPLYNPKIDDSADTGRNINTRALGGETIADWKDIGEPETMDLGFGKFLEITKRTNGKTTGIVISTGNFGLTAEGNKNLDQKYYKSRIYLQDRSEVITWLSETITKFDGGELPIHNGTS